MTIIPERTIKDMTSPDLNQQPLCIEYPDLKVNFELKSGLIHLLPTFCGLAGEDPHKHLKEFHVVCSGERLFEYWGRFIELVKSCPHHQIPDHLLIQYFYEGLSGMDRNLIDAASGGAMFNKTPTEIRNLISIMASNTQQFGTRYDDPPRKSNEMEGPPELELFAQPQKFQRSQYRPPMPPPPSNPKQGTPLEDMMKSLISNTQQIQRSTQQQIQQLQQKTQQFQQSVQQFQLSTQTSIQNLEYQMSQLTSSVMEKNCKNTQTKIALCAGTLKRKPEKEVEILQDQDDKTKEENPKVLVTRPPLSGKVYQIQKGGRREGDLWDFSQGASINVMPLTIFESLHVGQLKETGVVIQHADRLIVYPEGVLEDVLVQVKELIFPADFYVLDMREDNSPNSTSILLGRPFLKTTRTKIDVHVGTLTMEFDSETIRFNIFDSMRYPSDIPTALFVDAFDPFVQKFPAINDKDYIKFALEESPTSMGEENTCVDPLMQVNAKFDGDSVFLAKINKDFTYGPRTYKNKALHDK
ncbi:UNVERIFIED_CONTAM: hypothetical protein Scaly_2035100 [Sesamum calycinum]|uniref:Retrotransposon gag domain-containing protein n=1 Tax=Sesamum calycinum TaxID=2727403 RepID=A0AAW2N3U2_9LAMI